MKKFLLVAALVVATITHAFAGQLPLLGAGGAANPALLFDNFGFSGSHYPNNQVMAGQTPLTGPAWNTTGDSLPTVTSGQLTNTGLGYLYTNLSSTPQTLVAKVSFTGTNAAEQPFAMAWSNQTPPTLVIKQLEHPNWGPTDFTYGTFDASANFTVLMTNNWSSVMTAGTVYEVDTGIIGETAIMYRPDTGDKFCVSDPTISEWVGPMVFWEPITEADGEASQLSQLYAVNNKLTTCGTTTFNPNQKGTGAALSNGNLTVTATASDGSAEVMGVAGRTNGLVYFEVTYNNVQNPAATAIGFGLASIAEHTISTSVGLGGDTKSVGFFASTSAASIFQNNGGSGTTNLGAGMGPANGTTYGVALVLNNAGPNDIYVKNITLGTGWNNSSTANPVTNTGGVPIDVGGEPFAIDLQFFTSGDQVTINTGGSAFKGTPPTGFVDYLEP
jgi:hypothetical protein